jgi:hypothetical protein
MGYSLHVSSLALRVGMITNPKCKRGISWLQPVRPIALGHHPRDQKQVHNLANEAKASREQIRDAQERAIEVKAMGAADTDETESPQEVSDAGVSHFAL